LFGGTGPRGRDVGSSIGNRLSTRDRQAAFTRQSRALEQFFTYIRDQSGLTLLDLGGITQQNIDFITSLGHRLYALDFVRSLDENFGTSDLAEQANPGRIDAYLRKNMSYPDEHFDGVLIWDMLEFMAPPLLAATIDQLHRITRPKSYLLGFFHAEEKVASVPCYGFRILDGKTLELAERGHRQTVQVFNNRSLEKIFQKFESVKFFLTREHFREVIVKR